MKISSRILLLLTLLISSVFFFMSTTEASCGVFSLGSSCNTTIPFCNDGKCSLQGGIEAAKTAIGGTGVNVDQSISQYIMTIVRYLLSFVSLVAVIYVIWAGFQLMTGGGDDEKAKKAKNIILYVIVGIVIMWLAYAIVTWIINAVTGRVTTTSTGYFQLVPEASAYTENDIGTFDEYKKKLQTVREQLEIDLRVNGSVSSSTLQSAKSLITEAYNSLPDDPDSSAKNDSLKRAIDLYMQLAERSPGSTTHVGNLIGSISAFVDGAKINRITGTIEASPDTGNAPLTVTFRATDVVDPSGVIPSKDSFIWWTRVNGGVRRELGRGPTFTYTFTEEQTYTVFLDVISGSRNKKGRIDVLPFSASKQIEVQPRIGNVTLFLNGVNVSDLSSFKINPTMAKNGVLLDATASRGSNGTVIQKTKWNFGNDTEITYNGPPQMEKQVYANDGKYTLTLELENNQGKVFKKELLILVKDPASIIQMEKDRGFIGEPFRFSALSYFATSNNISYRWEITDGAGKRIHYADGTNTSFTFPMIGRYTVSLYAKSPNGKEDIDSREVNIDSKDPVMNFEATSKNPETPNTFTFDASRSFDADTGNGNTLTYSWRVDGSPVNLDNVGKNGATGTYTFSSLGEHTVNLSISNKYGKVTTEDKKITVTSLLSVELLARPLVSQIGNPVTINSIAPEAYFYEWSISDGSPNILGSEKQIFHTFKKSGSYDVGLTIRSKDGKQTNQITRKLYAVDTDSPFALIQVKDSTSNILQETQGICNGNTGFIVDRAQTITIDGSSSVNVDGTPTGVSYTWKFQGKTLSTSSINQKIEELGCFPVELNIRSMKNGASHTTKTYLDVRNLDPKITSISATVDGTTKKDSQKVIVNAVANGARDEDGVIVSYLWYYYTDSDPEPQNIRITQSAKSVFVLPNITEKYYFGVVLEDNDGAKTNSKDVLREGSPLLIANEDGNINLPLISLKTGNTTINVGEPISFNVEAKTILGKDITGTSEYLWDFDGDGIIDKKGTSPQITYTYTTSGTKSMKVKVVYNGVSNSKYQTIFVKNELSPNVSLFRVGSKVFVVNTSMGAYDTVHWTLGDFTSSNLYSASYDFGSTPLPNSGKLEIIDTSGNSKDIEFPIANVSEKNMSLSGVEIISVPELQGDAISVKSTNDQVYIGLFTNRGTKYQIDEDIRIDSDLDGTPDNDIDNKNTDSYVTGAPYRFTSLSSSVSREKVAKVTIYNGDTIVGSKNIKITLEYIQDSSQLSPTGSGSSATGEGFSDFDKNTMDALATKIRALDATDRAVLMQKYNILVENWGDPSEKTKILFEIQEYVDNSSLSSGDKTSIGGILNTLLVGEEQASDDVSIAIQAIRNLIPSSNPQYTTLSQKLDLIKSHPTNLIENKKLGTEILEIIKNDTTIEDKYKFTIKDQLRIIVSGGQQSVTPDTSTGSDTAGTSDLGAASSIMGFITGFVKIFLWIIAILLFIILLGFLWYTFSKKKDNIGFQDFIIDSIFHGGSHDGKTDVAPIIVPPTPIQNTTIVTPTVKIESKMDDPLNILTQKPTSETIDPLTQGLERVSTANSSLDTTPPASVVEKESTSVPDWLKVSPTQASDTSIAKTPTETLILEPEPLISITEGPIVSKSEPEKSIENTVKTEDTIPDWLKPAMAETTKEAPVVATISVPTNQPISSLEESVDIIEEVQKDEISEPPITLETTSTETVPSWLIDTTPVDAQKEVAPLIPTITDPDSIVTPPVSTVGKDQVEKKPNSTPNKELPDWLTSSVKKNPPENTTQDKKESSGVTKKISKTKTESGDSGATDAKSSTSANSKDLPSWLK